MSELSAKSTGMGRFLLVFIFRLLLLAVGGSLAALAGVAIATIYPNPTPNKPLVANMLEPLAGKVTQPENPSETDLQQSQDNGQSVATPTAFFADNARTAILPSDALFEANQTILRPEAGPILNQIASELQKYPGATILIAAHTDGAGTDKDNRALSFRQAQVIEQYLASVLNNRYHWLVVGYGETKPIAPNDTPANLQRNRRLEITIQ